MRDRVKERLAWASAMFLGVVAATRSRPAAPDLRAEPIAPGASAPGPTLPADSTARLARAAADRDPFRFERRPAAARFGETRELVQAPPPPPLPEFRLIGTMGGPPWQGVVVGFPNRESVLVRPGDRVGDFVVRAVTRDTAIIAGADTTWTLILGRPHP